MLQLPTETEFLELVPYLESPQLDELEQLLNEAALEQDNWQLWLPVFFPYHFNKPFANRHFEFWDWVEAIFPDDSPAPFIAIWPRGGAKSTNAEASTVRVGARQTRRYVWYVSETQDQADKHVAAIAGMLETSLVADYYPWLASRMLSKYGHSRGWKRNLLRCSDGFTVEAIGLEKAIRGGRMDWARPDYIIFDDVDNREDTDHTIDKKERIITDSILPAGASNVAVLFVQNLIHGRSIASRLADTTEVGADYLRRRLISGPFKAIEDLTYRVKQNAETGEMRTVIIDGWPTWEGQSLEVCQHQIDTFGIGAFLREAQNETNKDKPNALWDRDLLKDTRISDIPPLRQIVVAVDPHSTVGQTGIVVVGIGKPKLAKRDHGYTLEDATPPEGCPPEVWGQAAVAAYNKWQANAIVGEINHGGDMVKNVIRNVEGGQLVRFEAMRATRGKQTRAEPVATIFGEGRGHMAGYFVDLENELCGWEPGDTNSPNRLDAMVWGYTYLMIKDTSKQAGAW